MEKLKIGYCGDDCNCCPRYLATQSGNEERLKEVSAIQQIIGWRDHLESPDDITCHGCNTVDKCGLGIKECVLEKGVDSCGKCPDYPCEKLLLILRNNKKEVNVCKNSLSKEDFELFKQAFFYKKERLDKINKEYL